jgi:3-ketosteroid 9alpha-monooxygenase subunit B
MSTPEPEPEPEPETEHVTRHRIKQMEVMVADAVQETADTTTLVFFTGNDRLDYKAGHFLTIDPHQFEGLERFIAFLEDLKGKKEPPRAYSMASSPHEKYLAVTVKEERYTSGATQYPPLLSPLLVKRIPRGTRLVVTGFTGPYTLPEDIDSRTDHLVHVCAGSGSVPNFAILKYALAHHPKLRHTFVYSNRTWDDIIFRDQLTQLGRAHPDRLQIVHTLTREVDPARHGAGIRAGRLTVDLLREVIPEPSSVRVYACGPAISVWDRKAAREKGVEPTPRFLETVLEGLKTIGVRPDQVTRESYG